MVVLAAWLAPSVVELHPGVLNGPDLNYPYGDPHNQCWSGVKRRVPKPAQRSVYSVRYPEPNLALVQLSYYKKYLNPRLGLDSSFSMGGSSWLVI